MRDGDEANDSEEACHIEDLTGAFDDPEAQFNATTLSRKTMLTMYTLHTEDPEKHSVEALALKYKVRRQRVSAILVTEGAEARFKADGGELPGNGVEIDDLVVRRRPHSACGTRIRCIRSFVHRALRQAVSKWHPTGAPNGMQTVSCELLSSLQIPQAGAVAPASCLAALPEASASTRVTSTSGL